jgi:hypothetical protein
MPKKKAVKKRTVKTELTEIEKFYVEQKCKEGVPLEEISDKIKPVALVEQVYKQVAVDLEEKNKKKAKDMFGRNERYGAVVMTQNASEIGGDNKKNTVSQNSETRPSHIHKFRK